MNFVLTELRDTSDNLTFKREYFVGEDESQVKIGEHMNIHRRTWLDMGRPMEIMITPLCQADRDG